MNKIKELRAKTIEDSRGKETIECTLYLENGLHVTASVPSGASKSRYAILELRDSDGGVSQSCKIIEEEIQPLLKSTVIDIKKDDKLLYELHQEYGIGSNTMLAVSLCLINACSLENEKEIFKMISEFLGVKPSLPACMYNLINGGKHGLYNYSFQELMVVPQNFKTIKNGFSATKKVFTSLQTICREKKIDFEFGDEGGIVPRLIKTGIEREKLLLDLLAESIKRTGFVCGEDFAFALDVAASSMYKDGSYKLGDDNFSAKELFDEYRKLLKAYPIILLEDPFDQSDVKSWKKYKSLLSEDRVVVGDDIFATDALRIAGGLRNGLADGAIIKPNQCGTISRTLNAVKAVQKNNGVVVVSHRSGETMDTTIADIAVGCGADYFKCGAPVQKERVVKYERLVEIEKRIRGR